MYNKNYLIKMHGNHVADIQESDIKVAPKVKDNWNYKVANKIGKEQIEYGFESHEGKNYEHKIFASFYSLKPLEGFLIKFKFENFCKSVAPTYIPGSWCTPEQQEYNAAMEDNYFSNRD